MSLRKTRYRPDSFREFVQYVVELMDVAPETWRSNLTPWEQLVDRGFEEAQEGRLFSLISMISTAVSSFWKRSYDEQEDKNGVDFQECLEQDSVQGNWDACAFVPTTGLVRRLFYAKCRRGDLEWWRSMISSSEGEAQTICLALLVCWGKGDVIKNLSAEIGGSLDALDSDGWSWFWDLVSITMSVCKPQIERLDDYWFVDNDLLTERLAVVLTRRLTEESNRRIVARKCFLGYEGGDWRILQTAAEWELLSEPYSDIDWDFAKRLSVQARKGGVEYLFSHSHERHRVEVPVEVAEQVIEECGKHNWQFISLCEGSVRSSVAQNAKKVSTVSEEERWFHDELDE